MPSFVPTNCGDANRCCYRCEICAVVEKIVVIKKWGFLESGNKNVLVTPETVGEYLLIWSVEISGISFIKLTGNPEKVFVHNMIVTVEIIC